MQYKGYSLIELMITITIVGIIAAFAIPQYSSYVQRSNRTEALDSMHQIMDAQERYYAAKAKYTTTLSDIGFNTSTPGGNYTLSLSKCGSKELTQCIEVTATAVGDQQGDGNIVINSAGKRERDGKPL